MSKRVTLLAAGVVVAVAGWLVTAPSTLDPAELAQLTPDPAAGAAVFAATGCASCHSAEGTDALAGGKAFASDFGTFYAPNISSDPTHGIGAWSDHDIAQAILKGVSPDGAHYYPAFPYTSYNKMDVQDVADLVAHLRSLPADATPSRPHDVSFPFNLRRTLGVWKLLFENTDWVVTRTDSPQLERGRMLVEAMGHCAECHTPRNALGGLQTDQWMRGAPNPSGEGRIPSIHPDDLGWSELEIALYLQSGFTPDFDTVGGSMADVIDNTSRLSDADREAIAAYLLALD